MSSQISTNLVPSQHGNTSKESRHLSKFKPSFWGDIFLSSPSQMVCSDYEELKQEVRRMLVANTDKSSQKLPIIDAVQRLGVGYHFEKEIEEALEIIYHHHCNHIEIDGDDLYTTAVRFRLLREHGFNVHCETFNKFKDENGNFKESLIGDVKSMLELYEAAHFQLHGENILEEAISFTTVHLKLAQSTVDYPLSTQIANALKRPLRKSLPRLIARSYISIYEGYGTQDENLMKFANVYFEPHYAIARSFATKVICLISILDDIYDMKRQSQVYYVEAKWLHENYIPTMEEYMPIALVSCGYWTLTISSFVGMEDSITKETFNWAFNDPKIVRASSTICRLMSDIVGHKVERERGHVSSAVECYMKQYGVSMQEAYDELYKQINNAWKDINEEFLKPTAAPTSALNRILNLARVIDLLYTGEDAYTQVGESAKTSITALLIDPIPI
ncbi:hypothetical protein GOBAR_DD32020 [Gossypium barbadense]|nr:hypothetical protein GOBAR_DD32020 [Gossypium barbadense]